MRQAASGRKERPDRLNGQISRVIKGGFSSNPPPFASGITQHSLATTVYSLPLIFVPSIPRYNVFLQSNEWSRMLNQLKSTESVLQTCRTGQESATGSIRARCWTESGHANRLSHVSPRSEGEGTLQDDNLPLRPWTSSSDQRGSRRILALIV